MADISSSLFILHELLYCEILYSVQCSLLYAAHFGRFSRRYIKNSVFMFLHVDMHPFPTCDSDLTIHILQFAILVNSSQDNSQALLQQFILLAH